MAGSFRALVLEQKEDKKVAAAVRDLPEDGLPQGDVTVAVEYSTLNYKDGLILNGLGNLVRTYPHVGGIDLAGTVTDSSSPAWKPGDRVVLNGWRVGELHWGGYAQKARVKGDWLVRLPDAISTRRAMAIGTAGYTAMLCVLALEKHGLKPGDGEVLVTGAAGGVGSVAVAILAGLGHAVVASTGRPEQGDYLKGLGASAIIDRKELSEAPNRPLLGERFVGVVDSVGSKTLASALAMTKYGRSVAACGLAGGNDLPATVLPFILRGVNLLGIDSVMAPTAIRTEAWQRLGRDLPLDKLDAMTSEIGLADLPDWGGRILKGQVRGRVVVDPAK